MAIEFKKTTINGSQPAIWRGEVKMLPGGFAPAQTFPAGTLLKRGTPLYVDFDARTAAVCKTAKVLAGGTTTKVRVPKGHAFVAGDIVMKVGKTDVSPAISSIDTSSSEYDVLNLASGISGITANDIVAEATAYASESSPAAVKYTPNAIIGADKEFTGRGLDTIDAGYEALVLVGNIAVPYLADWVENGMCLKANHSIKLIKQ